MNYDIWKSVMAKSSRTISDQDIKMRRKSRMRLQLDHHHAPPGRAVRAPTSAASGAAPALLQIKQPEHCGSLQWFPPTLYPPRKLYIWGKIRFNVTKVRKAQQRCCCDRAGGRSRDWTDGYTKAWIISNSLQPKQQTPNVFQQDSKYTLAFGGGEGTGDKTHIPIPRNSKVCQVLGFAFRGILILGHPIK